MLNSGKKIRALRDKKNKYSNSCVVRKKILNETKNHNPPFKLNGRSLINGHKTNVLLSVVNIVAFCEYFGGNDDNIIANYILQKQIVHIYLLY
jgi:hypothetical protein